MSKERNHSSEDRLADTYRALANERAPDYLNEKVLRLAAGGRTKYARARAWMRPAAWAAVIGLSLAIVLDMTRLPQVEPDSIGIPVPDSREAGTQRRETIDAANESGAPKAEVMAPAAATPVEQRMDTSRTRPASGETDGPARLSNRDFVPKDLTVLRDAEEMARTQTGSDRGPIPPGAKLDGPATNANLKEKTSAGVSAGRADEGQAEDSAAAASFAAMAAPEATASAGYCAESVRDAPESWIACIRELEKNGREAEARDEYEAFRRVFPDFEVQDVDK